MLKILVLGPKTSWIAALAILALPVSLKAQAPDLNADQIVKAAIDYWRDDSSFALASMTVHRPSWERQMRFEAWTKGEDYSLIRFTAPAKDAGSASLKRGNEMWSYAPKINRVIKIPPSMMGQSWMGSDFSYNDLAKADDILENYTHSLITKRSTNLHQVYIIQSVPKEDAPVVWGKEILEIRDDYIILKHEFYDQDLKLIKRLRAEEIDLIGGKLYPRRLKMEQIEEPGKWTEVVHESADFDVKLNDKLFTLSYLRNPRRR